MLISKKSILNQIPNDLVPEREKVFIESLVHSIKMIDVSYQRLYNYLQADSTSIATELPMIEVWNIIDSSHRLRCIMDKTPGIKKKNIWFQLSLRKLKKVEEIRHLIQHYDREINTFIKELKPLLGHLSWVEIVDDDSFRVHIIVPGTVRKFKGLEAVNPLGKEIRNRIDLVTFYIGNEQICISDIYYKLRELVVGMERHLGNP